VAHDKDSPRHAQPGPAHSAPKTNLPGGGRAPDSAESRKRFDIPAVPVILRPMPAEHDVVFREAEKRIEEARRSRARALNLSDWKMEQGLKEIPESIGQLIWLEELDLSFNRLFVLPESLGNLKKLQVLMLHCGHHMPELPSFLGKLKELRVLDLGYRPLKIFPIWLGKLVKLQDLRLGRFAGLNG